MAIGLGNRDATPPPKTKEQTLTSTPRLAYTTEHPTTAQVLSRCVDFFIANGQFDKAVGLCITNRKHLRAIELCVAHKVGRGEGETRETGRERG